MTPPRSKTPVNTEKPDHLRDVSPGWYEESDEELDDDSDGDEADWEEEEFDEDNVADADDEEDTSPDTSRSEALKRRRIENSGGKTVSPLGRGKISHAGTRQLTRSGAPKRILAQQKRRDAIELRKMGVTYQKIADAVGYPSANEARKQVLKAYNEIIQEPAIELRGLQVERLNHLLTIAWQQAQGGSLSAINTCVGLMTRIDVLMGTEAAQKVEVVSINTNIISVNATQDEFIQNMKRFLNVNADGTNKIDPALPVLQQVHQAGQQPPPQAIEATPASKYPPGMEPRKERAEVIEDAVLVEADASGGVSRTSTTAGQPSLARDARDAQTEVIKGRIANLPPLSRLKKITVTADDTED